MNKYVLKICLALFFDSGILNGSNSDDFHFVVVGAQLTELTLDSVGHLDVFFGFMKTVKLLDFINIDTLNKIDYSNQSEFFRLALKIMSKYNHGFGGQMIESNFTSKVAISLSIF